MAGEVAAQVATVEAEAAAAASAATVAETAAQNAVQAAEVLIAQTVRNAAEEVREVVETTAQNEDEISCLKNQLSTLVTAQEAQARSLTEVKEALTLLQSTVSERSTPAPEPPLPSSAGVVDPLAVAKENPPAPAAPPEKPRRHRLL